MIAWALGWAHYCNGDLDLAEERLRETVALGPRAEQWIVAVASIADLSLIAGLRGRRAEQDRLAEEAVDLARERGLLDSVEVGEVHTARGVALAARGNPAAALPELEQGVMLRRLWGQQLDLVDGLLPLAAVTSEIGDRARAVELFDEADGILAGCVDPGALPTRLAAARRRAGIGASAGGADPATASSRCCACSAAAPPSARSRRSSSSRTTRCTPTSSRSIASSGRRRARRRWRWRAGGGCCHRRRKHVGDSGAG